MKNMLKILLLILLVGTINAHSQDKNKACCKIYDTVDCVAMYKDGTATLNADLLYELVNIVFKNCVYDIEGAPTKLLIVLTIDDKGRVIDAVFPKRELSSSCQFIFKERLLKMKGWKAAKRKGKNVCSRYRISIACLKWAE